MLSPSVALLDMVTALLLIKGIYLSHVVTSPLHFCTKL